MGCAFTCSTSTETTVPRVASSGLSRRSQVTPEALGDRARRSFRNAEAIVLFGVIGEVLSQRAAVGRAEDPRIVALERAAELEPEAGAGTKVQRDDRRVLGEAEVARVVANVDAFDA